MGPTWLTAFLDLPEQDYEIGRDFWGGVTGHELSAPRGASAEFASFLPPDGDVYLKVQRVAGGRPRIHLDLTVTDPRAAAEVAIAAGGTLLADEGYLVMRSPGGQVFCLVGEGGAKRAAPTQWPAGHSSSVYQVCLDLPAAQYDAEAGFWLTLFGAEQEVLRARPEFSWVRHPRQLALDVLLQATDEAAGEVRCHLDLGTTDRPTEVDRHLGLGATVIGPEEFWTVMRDPVGLIYCITDRNPATGRLVAQSR